jgi:double-stranded uracil-DNA glycosylase
MPDTGVSRSFAPVADANARVLILGSLPGQASLQAQQYYAHPHNAFWKVMGELFGATRELEYAQRLRVLRASGVALWDVCAAARRLGSLDTAIDTGSVEANDFPSFLEEHRHIELIGFNGAKAAHLYERRVLDLLPASARHIRRVTLPSTSPAHASLDFAAKLKGWSVLAEVAQGPVRPSSGGHGST